jgi:putative ABC transport system ATP-binding protein/lipoprotein-releasing system ATP-binding protein
MVGLKDKIHAYPSQLSGGQQRRVAIARSMMNDPELILGDEPTGDLDEETELQIMDLLGRVNRQSSVTIIFVTHNSELARTASKQLRMSNGRLHEI